MRKVLFFTVVMITFFGNIGFQQNFVNSASAQLALDNLVRACLPLKGRMVPYFNQPCHCPPQSFCPQTEDEWLTHPRMPGDQAIICCDPPGQCDISVAITGRACPGLNDFSEESIEVCADSCTQDCLDLFSDETDLNLDQWNTLQSCLAACDNSNSNETVVGGDPIGDHATDLGKFDVVDVWN